MSTKYQTSTSPKTHSRQFFNHTNALSTAVSHKFDCATASGMSLITVERELRFLHRFHHKINSKKSELPPQLNKAIEMIFIHKKPSKTQKIHLSP